jgi:geranylgeranyl pyrophosphate synthase
VYYLAAATPEQRAMVRDSSRAREAVDAIAHSPAVPRARARADALVQEAIVALQALPDTNARRALTDTAYYAVRRSY